MARKRIHAARLDELERRLLGLPPRSADRRRVIGEMALFYCVSETSLYRALRVHRRPKPVRRADEGAPRVLPREAMEHWCELVAVLKVRTSNRKGRCLSTRQAIRLVEQFGVETPNGLDKAEPGLLKPSTVNAYLLRWNYDRRSVGREPAAVRFQAEQSNECWQFDLSPSDLKQLKEPPWLRRDRPAPTLMLFSVVDDRSGVAYQEYRSVYGEEQEAALRFLFNAMAEKEGFRSTASRACFTWTTTRWRRAACFRKSCVTSGWRSGRTCRPRATAAAPRRGPRARWSGPSAP